MKRAIKNDVRMTTVDGKRRRVKTPLGFQWDDSCERAFQQAKQGILDTVRSGGVHGLQYHLATDASGTGAGGVLIQLPHHPPGTNLLHVPKEEHTVIIFLSFQFTDTERRYHTTEREFLALLRSLEEVQSLVYRAGQGIGAGNSERI